MPQAPHFEIAYIPCTQALFVASHSSVSSRGRNDWKGEEEQADRVLVFIVRCIIKCNFYNFPTPVLSPCIINESEHSTVWRATRPDNTVLFNKMRLNTSLPLTHITDFSDNLSTQNATVTHIIRAACPATQRNVYWWIYECIR